jgi:bifunctional ADP-heptose synthase (sugar kinase/adenylyltransferase)
MDEARLDQLLGRFPEIKLLVIGDFFLDKYLDLERRWSETSLETGLEAYQAAGVRCSPGAAGTVVNNLRTLDVGVMALGVIGDDGEGYELKRALMEQDVDISPLIVHPDRFTPTYTKPMMREMDDQVHELNRIDVKNRSPLPEVIQRQLIERLRALAPSVNGMVVADQVPEANCGVITDQIRTTLSEVARSRPDLIIAADSRERIGLFRNIILKLETAGATLHRQNERPVFITVGAEGVLVFSEGDVQHVPGVPVTGPIDIVGAGDSVMAGIVSSLCAGGEPAEAALVGNLVASITVQQLGTTGNASRQQVLDRFREYAQPRGGK